MQIPPVIVQSLDEKMQARIAKLVPESQQFVKNLKKLDKNIKVRTRDLLLYVYRSVGYVKFLEVVDNLRIFKGREFGEMIQAKGEIAEVVFEVIISQFISEFGLDNWIVDKGVILGNSDNSSFSTELDLLLCTPHVVVIAEVKSYNGKKTISGRCTLSVQRKGEAVTKDIFSQNSLHIRTFWDNFHHLASSGDGAVKSMMLSFSVGELEDNRAGPDKSLMPIYTESTFPSFLLALKSITREPIWDIEQLGIALSHVRKNARSAEEHIKYVQSMHGEGDSDE